MGDFPIDVRFLETRADSPRIIPAMARIERNQESGRACHRNRGGFLSHDKRVIDIIRRLDIAFNAKRVDCRCYFFRFIGSARLIFGHGRQSRPLVLLDLEAAILTVLGQVDFRKLLLAAACLDLRLHLEKAIVTRIVDLQREERGCPRACLRFDSPHLSRRGLVQQRSRADGGALVVDRYGDFLFGARSGRGLVKIDEAKWGLFDRLGRSKLEGTDTMGPVDDTTIVGASGNALHFAAIGKSRRICDSDTAHGSREQCQGRERENEGEREKYSAI